MRSRRLAWLALWLRCWWLCQAGGHPVAALVVASDWATLDRLIDALEEE